ncbi:MAG: 6-phosphofructokinase [Bacteroidota bacterium]|nr:6-phosphofructokinase [Bacteroidota bacterium]MDP4231655.1 6-phosphofructokinase [Bacteroidota bacterium]MDP4236259.1 6-phosphofructokinase [Bacteroidota bacterium]
MKTIGVLTAGGDAPGMNACIRAITRVARHHNIRVLGVEHGFSGLIAGDYTELIRSSVSNIIQRGGTILKSARTPEFLEPGPRKKAYDSMRSAGMDGLIVIGGDGTALAGAALCEEFDIPVIGCPGTIDNDLFGTDETIGFDTAVNTALENIDKIRDTADAFERTFYIEVMGRTSGFIALDVGLSCGAEFIAIPENKTRLEDLLKIFKSQRATKRSNMIIVAEGDEEGGAFKLAQKVKDHTGVDYRVAILGHVQRGGSPTARDRILASKLGAAAVDALIAGKSNLMTGEVKGALTFTPLRDAAKRDKPVDALLFELAKILAE